MITHGRQQILPPNMIIGRTQISVASIGIERIVGLWLGWQAVQAIVNAFGQRDGWAVINATNAYLNGIAAQGAAGKAKAQALAALINEDPMMVCSLGLEVQGVTMPIRWLVSDGASWIDSGYNVKSNTWFKGRFITTRRDAPRLSGALYLNGSNASLQIGNTSGLKLYSGFGSLQQGSDIVVNRVYDFEITNTRASVIWDGGSFIHSYSAISVTNNVSLTMFARNRGTEVDCLCYWNSPFFEYGDDSESHKVVPFVSQTRNGMVDLVNMVFHPNQGTGHFTDAYTLQDGVTPWTPSTP